jgi:hypothetical protein
MPDKPIDQQTWIKNDLYEIRIDDDLQEPAFQACYDYDPLPRL